MRVSKQHCLPACLPPPPPPPPPPRLTQVVEGPHDEAEAVLVQVVLAVVLHPHALHVLHQTLQAEAAQRRHRLPPGHRQLQGNERLSAGPGRAGPRLGAFGHVCEANGCCCPAAGCTALSDTAGTEPQRPHTQRPGGPGRPRAAEPAAQPRAAPVGRRADSGRQRGSPRRSRRRCRAPPRRQRRPGRGRWAAACGDLGAPSDPNERAVLPAAPGRDGTGRAAGGEAQNGTEPFAAGLPRAAAPGWCAWDRRRPRGGPIPTPRRSAPGAAGDPGGDSYRLRPARPGSLPPSARPRPHRAAPRARPRPVPSCPVPSRPSRPAARTTGRPHARPASLCSVRMRAAAGALPPSRSRAVRSRAAPRGRPVSCAGRQARGGAARGVLSGGFAAGRRLWAFRAGPGAARGGGAEVRAAGEGGGKERKGGGTAASLGSGPWGDPGAAAPSPRGGRTEGRSGRGGHRTELRRSRRGAGRSGTERRGGTSALPMSARREGGRRPRGAPGGRAVSERLRVRCSPGPAGVGGWTGGARRSFPAVTAAGFSSGTGRPQPGGRRHEAGMTARSSALRRAGRERAEGNAVGFNAGSAGLCGGGAAAGTARGGRAAGRSGGDCGSRRPAGRPGGPEGPRFPAVRAQSMASRAAGCSALCSAVGGTHLQHCAHCGAPQFRADPRRAAGGLEHLLMGTG